MQMERIIKILKVAFYALAFILAIFCLLSIFHDSENRFFKILGFPRIQFFIASVICLLIIGFTFKKWNWQQYLLTILIFGGLLINAGYLINYTSIVPVDVPNADQQLKTDHQLNLLIANVKMSNRNSAPLINLVKSKRPDLVLAMEIDAWWKKELKVLDGEYPFSQQQANDVAYGMVLYSKLPLKEVEVDYLNNQKVPSFESTISFPDGKNLSFHGVHPVPPTHFKDLPDNAGQQENALIKLGNEITDRQFPTIVAGDLNDAVWSRVDALTQTENILFDVRVGRGFYNSYNAHNFFMSWPLDHVFVTKEFKLKSLELLDNIGSDHYPIYVELVL